MHVKAIKMPRVENTLLISDIKEKMKGNVAYTKVCASSCKKNFELSFRNTFSPIRETDRAKCEI